MSWLHPRTSKRWSCTSNNSTILRFQEIESNIPNSNAASQCAESHRIRDSKSWYQLDSNSNRLTYSGCCYSYCCRHYYNLQDFKTTSKQTNIDWINIVTLSSRASKSIINHEWITVQLHFDFLGDFSEATRRNALIENGILDIFESGMDIRFHAQQRIHWPLLLKYTTIRRSIAEFRQYSKVRLIPLSNHIRKLQLALLQFFSHEILHLGIEWNVLFQIGFQIKNEYLTTAFNSWRAFSIRVISRLRSSISFSEKIFRF